MGYSRFYPQYGWKKWPDRSTPWSASLGEQFDQGIYDVKTATFDPKDYGTVVADGLTDDALAWQAAIDAAFAAGGGRVTGRNVTYAIAETLTLKSGVVIDLEPGSTLKWIGSVGGTMITNDITSPLMRSGVTGGILDPNSTAGYVFNLHSPQKCKFDVTIGTGSATTMVWKAKSDATSNGYASLRQVIWNDVKINAPYTIGTGIWISGDDAGTYPATLNHLHIEARDVKVDGVIFYQWANNNSYAGRVNLTANNCRGVVMNDTATPSVAAGVDSNNSNWFAVDTPAGGETGRKAVVLNYSRFSNIHSLFQDPVAEGGVIVDNYSQSHHITARALSALAPTDSIEVYVKNEARIDSPIEMRHDDGGGNNVKGVWKGSSASYLFGTSSSHPTAFIWNNVEQFRLTTSGIQLAAGKVLELGSGGARLASNAGTPEGSISAPPGSYCADSTNGEGYVKQTGTGNTGWKLVTHDTATLNALSTLFNTATTPAQATAELAIAKGTDGAFTVGSSTSDGVFQSSVRDAAHVAIHRSLTGDRLEWGLSLQVTNTATSSGGVREKAALIAQAQTSVDSAVPNNVDVLGAVLQGYISGSATTGRAWGGISEAQHASTSNDGLLIAHEIGITNLGSVVTSPDSQTAKIGLWLASHATAAGASKGTAAIAFSATTGQWHYGAYMRHVTGTFIRMANPDAASAIGIDMVNDTNWGEAIRIPNNKALRSYNAAGVALINLARANASDQIVLGDTANDMFIQANNYAIGGGAGFGNGIGVISIPNATAPNANPVGGGILYVDAGALKYRGSSGTVTPLAPA